MNYNKTKIGVIIENIYNKISNKCIACIHFFVDILKSNENIE